MRHAPYEGLTTKRKGGTGTTTKRKRNLKRRDLPALSLQDRRFRSRVVKNAKVYSRRSKLQGEDEDET